MTQHAFFENRLKVQGDLQPVVQRACEFYNLPAPRAFELFTTGFKDYSMRLDLSDGSHWVLKIFSKETGIAEITRYESIILQAIAGGVNHPTLRSGKNTELVYTDPLTGMHMSLVEYVPGDLLDTYKSIPADIFRKVISEAVKISRLDIHPPHRFDMWQVTNIRGLYNETQHVLDSSIRQQIEETVASYEAIVRQLPYGFVHGDMTRTNIIARSDQQGEIALLDFGASGTYPRIHELSILAVHFLADGILSLDACIQAVCDEFISQGGILSDREREGMLSYTQAILATKYLCNVYEIDEEIETEEMVYWRDISITYLMADIFAANPERRAAAYRDCYKPSMWLPK